MKTTSFIILALTSQIIQAQDIIHDSNGDGLKLSLDVPGAQGSATAGGTSGSSTSQSSISSSTTGTKDSEKPSIPNVQPGDYIRSTPEPGTGGGYRESTVYLEHNGKSVKVTRRPGRAGVDEVTVTTKDGGKEKVEVMTPTEYEQKYLRKKGGKKKPSAEEKPGKATEAKDPAGKKHQESPTGPASPAIDADAPKVENDIEEKSEDRKTDESSDSASPEPTDGNAPAIEVPAAPTKPNRATE